MTQTQFILHKLILALNKAAGKPHIRRSAWIDSRAIVPKSCIIAERVKIKGDKIFIGENVFINSDVKMGAEVTIGKGTRIEPFTCIGSCTTLGKPPYLQKELFPEDGHVSSETDDPIKIGEYVAIGCLCNISKGVTIGEKSVIRDGAVVVEDVPAFAIVQGNPAKIIGYREFEKRKKNRN